MPAVGGTGAGADIEHSRRAAAILHRLATLIERHAGEGIAIESGEQTGQMAHVVDRHMIVEDGILHRRAATHLETARHLALLLHAGQQLHGAKHIALA